jgi:threonine synthase
MPATMPTSWASKMDRVRCTNCLRPYPEQGVPYRCPTCGGHYDFSPFPNYDPAALEPSLPGIWRYRHAFGLPDKAAPVSLGEGSTPLVWLEDTSLAAGRPVGFKLEFLNPTGSFKDRGSSTLVSFLTARQIEAAVEDSSGNAGASFAAYAARAGLAARLYLPDSASGPKRSQIAAYGAEIVAILGPRSNAATAAQKAASQGAVYASHAYLPYNLPGYATLAYELYEQLGQAPGTLVIPVGQGGLLLGAARGFEALQAAGLISRIPHLVGVQARACSPLWALFSYGAEGLMWSTEGQTLAEGIQVSQPVRGDAVMRSVENSGGAFVAVDEQDIVTGRDHLARRGLYVEATSAVIWSALAQLNPSFPDPIVAALTGSGLKSP